MDHHSGPGLRPNRITQTQGKRTQDMAQTASELETELYALIGKYPGYPRGEASVWDLIKAHTTGTQFEIEHNRQVAADKAEALIRRWIIAKGVEEKHVWKMTPYSLGNAYRGGNAYLASIGKDDNRRPPSTRRDGRRPIPIDLLNETPDGDEGVAPVIVQQPAQISESMVRRVCETIIDAQVSEAQRRLNLLRTNLTDEIRADIRTGVANAKSDIESYIESLGLGQHLTDAISDVAIKAAQRAANEMLPHKIELKFPNGEIKILDAEVRHEKFNRILKWLLAGHHVYIVGPRGTGKTHLGAQLRDALRAAFNREDLDVYFIDQSLTKYDVKGFKGPTGEYVDTLVRQCVEKGGILFIDEGDMWAAQALGSLNSILANKFGAFPDKIVAVHKDFRCVLAANTYGHGADRMYQGRNPLDAASLDRFSYVTMDYDRNMERQIYGGQNDAWLEYVWRLRDASHATGNADMEPSMRAIEAGINGLRVGLTVDEILEDRIWKGASQDKINKILAAAGSPPRPRQELREIA